MANLQLLISGLQSYIVFYTYNSSSDTKCEEDKVRRNQELRTVSSRPVSQHDLRAYSCKANYFDVMTRKPKLRPRTKWSESMPYLSDARRIRPLLIE